MVNPFVPSATVADDPAGAVGVLTFDQAGRALNVNALAIERLVARRRLPAVLVGGDQRRISATALREYLDRGGFDLRGMPPNDGRWYVGNDGYSADGFGERLASLARADLPTDPAEIRRLVMDKLAGLPADRAVDLPLALNASMKKAISAPAGNSRYASAGQEFLASRLRRVAKDVINRGAFVASPIDKLYFDPATYDQITAAAMDELRKRPALSFTSFHVLPGISGQPVAVSWVLPMADVLAAVGGNLLDVAF